MSNERQLVREFCRNNKICTRCTCKPALSNGELCAKCFDYAIKAPKSLGRTILRESKN